MSKKGWYCNCTFRLEGTKDALEEVDRIVMAFATSKEISRSVALGQIFQAGLQRVAEDCNLDFTANRKPAE